MRTLFSRAGSGLAKRVVNRLLNKAVTGAQPQMTRKPFIGVESLESRVMLASEAVVAVLDTGIDLTNVNILNSLWINRKDGPNTLDDDLNGFIDDLFGWNFVNNSGAISTTGHGDAMARAVLNAAQTAATAAGVATDVKIMPVVVATSMSAVGSIGGGTWVYGGSGTGTWQLSFAGASWKWTGPGNSAGPTAGTGTWTYKVTGPSPASLPPNESIDAGDWSDLSPAFWEWVDLGGVYDYTNFNTFNGLGQPLGQVSITDTSPVNNTGHTWFWVGPGTVDADDNWTPSVSTAQLGQWTWVATGPGPGIVPGNPADPDPESTGPGTGAHVWDPLTNTWTWQSVTQGNNGNTVINQMLTGGTWDSLINGINYVVTQKRNGGANVVAMTINTSGYWTTVPGADFTVNALKAAIENATRAGIAVFTGAGNSGFNNDIYPNYPSNLSASRDLLISVAAADDTGALASFSNFGRTTVDVGVVGTNLVIPSVAGTQQGTDFATAIAAGNLAALSSAKNIGASAAWKQMLANAPVTDSLSTTTITGKFIGATSAGQTIIGNKALVYSIDVLNANKIMGWAYDANGSNGTSTITVKVNGTVVNTFVANTARPDLAGFLPATNIGINYTLPSLSAGLNTIEVLGTDVNPDGTTTSRTLATTTVNGNILPIGSVDLLDGTQVVGWAWDKNAGATSIDVVVVVDGVTEIPDTASDARPDLNAFLGSSNHGFTISLASLTVGPHRVEVYAIDSTTSQRVYIGGGSFVKNQTPVAIVDSFTTDAITGWGVDLDDTTQSLNYRIEIDGVSIALQQSNINRSDLNTFISANGSGGGNGNGKGFSFALPALSAGLHTINLYAIDTNTGGETLIFSQGVNGNRSPIGAIDSVNGQLVGWAADPDVSTSIKVRIDIDDSVGTPFTANVSRPDLVPVFGTSQFGIVYNMPELRPGAHTVRLYAYDSTSNAPVLIGTRNITTANTIGASTRPTGAITAISATSVSGWAYDNNLGAAAATVRIDINGVTVASFNAADPVAGLPGSVAGANHGFTYAIPGQSGPFVLSVYVIDDATATPILIRTAQLNDQPATGSFSTANLTTIAGNIVGPSNPRVRIDINDVPGRVITATGGAFSINTPPLPLASNSVKLYVIEEGSETAVLVASTTLARNQAAIGSVDILNGTQIVGWAGDLDDINATRTVIIAVNGIDAIKITSTVSRPDLASLGNTNLGFNYSFGSVFAAGNNRITVKAVDVNTGIVTILADRIITFA